MQKPRTPGVVLLPVMLIWEDSQLCECCRLDFVISDFRLALSVGGL